MLILVKSCFQSNGFLELSKSNLIPLLKSDSLAMAEVIVGYVYGGWLIVLKVDIFKAVICWGNNQVKLYKRSLAEELVCHFFFLCYVYILSIVMLENREN